MLMAIKTITAKIQHKEGVLCWGVLSEMKIKIAICEAAKWLNLLRLKYNIN